MLVISVCIVFAPEFLHACVYKLLLVIGFSLSMWLLVCLWWGWVGSLCVVFVVLCWSLSVMVVGRNLNVSVAYLFSFASGWP